MSAQVVMVPLEQLVEIIDKAVAAAIERKLRPPATTRAQTIREFAETHHVSEATVRRLIADGLPVVRVGRRGVRIPAEPAAAWLANRKSAA